jgi:hypothetical protein
VFDSDGKSYVVTVTRVSDPQLRATNEQIVPTEVVCTCRFYVTNRMMCSHTFAVLNNYQIKSAAELKPSERWTKRYNWENYSTDVNALQFHQERALA